MKVVVASYGEPLPLPDNADRLLRAGMLARELVRRGHHVTWFSSTFDHSRKSQFFGLPREMKVEAGLTIRLARTRGYRRHVSVARLYDHWQLGRALSRTLEEGPIPDLVFTGLPTLDMSVAAVSYGIAQHVPVVIDVRDWWPDIFTEVFPRVVKPFVRIALTPFERMANSACRGATAITGITDEFVSWALRRAARQATELDRAFPFSYGKEVLTDQERGEALARWQAMGLCPSERRFIVSFVGSLGVAFDLEPVLEAARLLSQRAGDVVFVIAGNGDQLPRLRAKAAALPNVILPGWIDASQIQTLMEMSAVGLDPLPDRRDYIASINNKAVEYLSAGLPVLSSPETGVLATLLSDNGCGVSFGTGDARALAAAIEQMKEDPSGRAAMARNAADLFDKKFSHEVVMSSFANHLEHVACLWRS